MERFNLLDLKYSLTQRWGMAFGRGFPLMSWQEGIFERGKDHSISHRAILKKRFSKVILSNEKHFVLSPNEEQELPRSKADLG